MKLRHALLLLSVPVLMAACQSTVGTTRTIPADQTALRFDLKDEGFPEVFTHGLRYPGGGGSIELIAHSENAKFASMSRTRVDAATYIKASTLKKQSEYMLPEGYRDMPVVERGSTATSIGVMQTALFQSGDAYCLGGMVNGTPRQGGYDSITTAFFCDQRPLTLADGDSIFDGMSVLR